MKRQRELEQEAAETAKKSTAIVKAGNTGFSLESADGQNVIKLRGLLQADYHYYFEGSRDVRNRSDQRAGDLDSNGFSNTGDTWLLRRVRPIIQGTLLGYMTSALPLILPATAQQWLMPTLMPASIRPLRFAQVYSRVLSG